MKYFLYCRKSSDREDRQILGPEAQKRLLLEFAGKKHLDVVDVYVEHQTAYKSGRPLLNEMLKRLERGEGDAILTYHLTRLARNSFDGGRIIYMMDERTIREISTLEKTYTNHADDKFLMQIHFAMAKKSSDDTSQFVTRDIESKLLKGEYPGLAPRGYLNITRDGHIARSRDTTERYLQLLKLGRPLRREEIDPVEGPLVRWLFEQAAEGKKTVRQLQRLGFQAGLRCPKSGRMLTKATVRNILTNPYYYGAIEYRGKLYTQNVQHEPLVSKAVFDRAVQALGRRGRFRKHVYTFGRGFAHCGSCGSVVTAETHKGHVYYRCAKSKTTCDQKKFVREEALEYQVIELLDGLRIPRAFAEYARGRLPQVQAEQEKVAAHLRGRYEARVAECQGTLERLLEFKTSPNNADGRLLSDEEYLRQRERILEELDACKRQLSGLGGTAGAAPVKELQSLIHRFNDSTSEEKQSILHQLGTNWKVRDGRITGELREPYSTLVGLAASGQGNE